MFVRSARLRLVEVPLFSPFVISRGAVRAFTNVVLELEDDSGLHGWGEAVPVSLTENPRDFLRILAEDLVPRMIRRQIDDIGALIDELKPYCCGNEATLAAIDLALWDLLGKQRGVSVGTLMGASEAQPIGVDFTLSALSKEETIAQALKVIQLGYGGVVVKITCADPKADAERVAAVCAVLSADRSVRVDANGGFDIETACRFIDMIADLPVAFLEQPVKAADFAGMKACRGRGVAIAADESLKLPEDAARLVEEEACDVLNLKVTKAGGISQSMRVARIAEASGLPLVIGGGLTFGISRFASQHIAGASAACAGICHQGPGPASQALSGDITFPRLTPETMRGSKGVIFAPTAPGLGFDIDPVSLAGFTLDERKI